MKLSIFFKNAQHNLHLILLILIYSQVLFNVFVPFGSIAETFFGGVLGGSILWIIKKYQLIKNPFDQRVRGWGQSFCVGMNLCIGIYCVSTFSISVFGHMFNSFL